jgi:hypothetical protein
LFATEKQSKRKQQDGGVTITKQEVRLDLNFLLFKMRSANKVREVCKSCFGKKMFCIRGGKEDPNLIYFTFSETPVQFCTLAPT